MKKLLFVFLVLICSAVSAFPRSQFRLVGETSAEFVSRQDTVEIDYQLDYPGVFMSGFSWEVITNSKVGFGQHYLVRFTRLTSTNDYWDYDWWFDWNGDIFLSFHFFRVGRVFDPFLQVGYGCAGRVNMNVENENYWVEDAAGNWYYAPSSWSVADSDYSHLTNISLYPFIAAGIALDLKGFLLSCRATYRPFLHAVPGTGIDNYPLKNLQIVISAGVAFGGHRR